MSEIRHHIGERDLGNCLAQNLKATLVDRYPDRIIHIGHSLDKNSLKSAMKLNMIELHE